MSGTYAIVVTHNRIEKLKQALDCIAAQDMPPDRVVVVDNASTDGTPGWLAGQASGIPGLHVISLPENTGGAGGFHAGVAFACQDGAEHIWLMDDDCFPEASALSELHRALHGAAELRDETPTFACSLVLWTDGSLCEMNNPVTAWDWPRAYSGETPYVLVTSCSFASMLFSADIVRRCGYPLKEYFIWFDDVEYSSRLSRHGPGVCVLSSVVRHAIAENRGVNYGFVNRQNVWKYALGMRNEGSWTLRQRGFLDWLVLVRDRIGQMRAHHVPGSLMFKILRSAIVSLWFNPKAEFPPER